MNNKRIVFTLIAGAILAFAVMVYLVPLGANASVNDTLKVELRLNSYSDTRPGGVLVLAVVDGEVRATNYVTEGASGVDVTDQFTFTRQGSQVKVLLSGMCLPGWYGNQNECVSVQSSSAFWCQTAQVELVGKNGAASIQCEVGLHSNLDAYDLNDMLDWVVFTLRQEPTPIPTPAPSPTSPPTTPLVHFVVTQTLVAINVSFSVSNPPEGAASYNVHRNGLFVGGGAAGASSYFLSDIMADRTISNTYTVSVVGTDSHEDGLPGSIEVGPIRNLWIPMLSR